MINSNYKLLNWVLLIALSITWGSSFILMKRGLEVYSHLEVAAIRMVIASLFFIPFAINSFKKVTKKDWLPIIGVGLFGNGIPAFLFTKAQTALTSSLTGMLNSLVPLFTLIIGVLIFSLPTTKIKVIGVFVGLLGAIGLITANGIDFSDSNFSYSFYVVAATICYALSVNIIKKHLININPLTITSLALFSIAFPILFYLFTTDFVTTTINNPKSPIALGYLSILSIVGTALSVWAFNILIKRSSALFAASVTYLIPIVAIFWGFIDGESISIVQILMITVILGGVYLVNKS